MLEPPIIAGRRLTAQEFAALPRREFAEVGLQPVLGAVAGPTLLLFLYTGFTVMLARRRFRTFTVAAS